MKTKKATVSNLFWQRWFGLGLPAMSAVDASEIRNQVIKSNGVLVVYDMPDGHFVKVIDADTADHEGLTAAISKIAIDNL